MENVLEQMAISSQKGIFEPDAYEDTNEEEEDKMYGEIGDTEKDQQSQFYAPIKEEVHAENQQMSER